jgi:hypothetical protein
MDMVQEVRRQFKEIPGIMEYKATPEYDKCVEISTKASIREMIAPGAIALLVPIVVGFAFGPEVLGGLLAGVTVSGVLMGIFQNNAGGAWDNAKKSFEKGVEINGTMEYKGSEPHKASVTGDTVGDPFKDTSGPSMNILIKLMSIVSLIIAPHIHVGGDAHHAAEVEVESTMSFFESNVGKQPSIEFNTIEVEFQGEVFELRGNDVKITISEGAEVTGVYGFFEGEGASKIFEGQNNLYFSSDQCRRTGDNMYECHGFVRSQDGTYATKGFFVYSEEDNWKGKIQVLQS